ncbi:MAG: NAD(+) synthase [Candidatus Gracilibacteria bacterium]|nr:NAD(+) synthase [Candidatus Gracilibacteria bacterium]
MITLSQTNIVAGRPDINTRNLIRDICIAEDKGSDLHVATELAISGYMIGDEWENEAFVRECEDMNQEIINATRDSVMSVIWGNILSDPVKVNEDGRIRKYNAAFVARNGVLIPNKALGDGAFALKTNMPKYRYFDDERHITSLKDLAFEEGASIDTIDQYYRVIDMTIDGVKRNVGVIICEDMWDDDYVIKVVDILKKKGVNIIVNLSASPFGIGKQGKRDRLLARQSKGIDIVYTNRVGAENNSKNEYVYDGASVVFRDGKKIFQVPSFQEGVFEVQEKKIKNEEKEMRKIENALIYGIREYMRSSGQKKLVIGLSGGIDSALVAALAVQAIGAENVITVNMPSVYNSDMTKDLARDLARELGIEYHVVPIQESVDFTKAQIGDILGIKVEGLMEENIQARDRGSRVLMAIAAQSGCIMTNNGNKLEIATGFASIAGDLNGAIAPIADLYKTQIFALSRMMSQKYSIPTLAKICDIPPSAELSKDQAIEEGKGDPFFFEYHDRLMYQFLEMRRDPAQILTSYQDGKLEELLNSWTYDVGTEYALKKPIIGADGYFPTIGAWVADVERIWKLFRGASTIKGKYIPTIISLSRRALGYDLRRSEMSPYFLKKYEEKKGELLEK